MASIPVALQMYTVRREADLDFVGTLREVARIGYAGVELAGLPITVEDLKLELGNLGLQVPSMHFAYDNLVNDLDRTVDTALRIGMRYVACPWLPEAMHNEDGFRKAAEELSRVGEECAQHGLELCYHNHAFEFQRFDGECGYDILMGASNPRFLKAQIDTYWVRYGGADPADYIRRYTGRCPMVHLKDMADDADRSFAEVGSGVMDFDVIFDAATAAGTAWYVVEQDICKGSALDSARISFENLKLMGMVP